MADARARTGLLLGFAAYASWGLLSPVGKRLLLDFDPLTQNAVRFAIATAILLPILGFAAFRDGVRLLRRREIVVLNLVSHVSLTMFIYSLRDLEPAHATLAFYSAPLWTALLARAMLREHVGALFLPASAGLLAGGYLALFGWAGPGAVDNVGLLVGVLSAGVWGYYTVEVRRHAPGVPLKPFVATSFLVGTPFYVLLALAFEGAPDLAAVDGAAWGWMLLHIAVPTLAAVLLFNAALQRAPAGAVNILVAAELAFTVLFSWLLFGDRFSALNLAGVGLAVASVTGYLWVQMRRPATAAA